MKRLSVESLCLLLVTVVGCSGSGGGGVAALDVVEIPVRLGSHTCNAESMNNTSQVLLLCGDDSSKFYAIWDKENGMRKHAELDPLLSYGLYLFADNGDIFVNSNPIEESSNSREIQALRFHNGSFRQFGPKSFRMHSVSSDGRFVVGDLPEGERTILFDGEVGREILQSASSLSLPFVSSVNGKGDVLGLGLREEDGIEVASRVLFIQSGDTFQIINPLEEWEDFRIQQAQLLMDNGDAILYFTNGATVDREGEEYEIGRAVVRKPNGEFINIGPANPLIDTYALAANNNGVIAGYFWDYNLDPKDQAGFDFLYSESSGFLRAERILPSPYKSYTIVDINDRNEALIVGAQDGEYGKAALVILPPTF